MLFLSFQFLFLNLRLAQLPWIAEGRGRGVVAGEQSRRACVLCVTHTSASAIAADAEHFSCNARHARTLSCDNVRLVHIQIIVCMLNTRHFLMT